MQQTNSITLIKRGQVDVLHIENQHAIAQVALFGAHVLSFKPKSDNRERLWLSETAIFDNRTPIRGGIPICWPWFSDAHNQPRNDLPSHGFLRNQIWQLDESKEDSDVTRLYLSPTTTKGPGWDYDCQCGLTIEIGKTLKISLHTTSLENHGQPLEPENHGQPLENNHGQALEKDHLDHRGLPINCAFHSYFAVNNIENTKLRGLEGVYLDKTQNWKCLSTPEPYVFCAETDRIHLTKTPKVTISDDFETHIYSQGHDSIVVWNPWSKINQKMKDMHDNGYQNMLCVETAITQPHFLLPGEHMVLIQNIE